MFSSDFSTPWQEKQQMIKGLKVEVIEYIVCSTFIQ